MEKVRNRATRELGDFDLDPVDKIVLAVDNNVPEWLKPAFIALCQREEPIREEEAKKLGWSTTVKLAHAREKARENSLLKEIEIVRKSWDEARSSASSHCRSCGWTNDFVDDHCNNGLIDDHDRVPTHIPVQPLEPAEGKLDPALVESMVTGIFWPASPVSPEGGPHGSPEDGATASKGKGKKCKKCKK
jgi:hypothetical protein